VSRIVAVGEVLLRLKSPGPERLFQSPALEARFGGAELNALAALSSLGHSTSLVTTLPESVIGDAALAEIRRLGVGVAAINRAPGRMGLYFAESGQGVRSGLVLYDRAGSAFANSAGTGFDWGSLLADAGLLHLTGVTPAVSPRGSQAAADAVASALTLGKDVSFDVNFRAPLWEGGAQQAQVTLGSLMRSATTLFASAYDLATFLALKGKVGGMHSGLAEYEALTAAAFDALPRLRMICTYERTGDHATHNTLVAAGRDQRGFYVTAPRKVEGIVDRIGAGDAFAAGVLHQLLAAKSCPEALEFALAATALKHSVPGDVNLASEEEITAILAGHSPAKIRR
jgi:2-dehydro-3-deoxygluconokinase